MSITIALPATMRRRDGVHAGVQFTAGIAEVPELGHHTARFFEALGASVTDTADPIAELRVGDKLLTDCTIPELRDLAETEGIDLPARAKKHEILRAFLVAFMDRD